jgi:hypothetical protein
MIDSTHSTSSTSSVVSGGLPLAVRTGALIFAATLQFWPCPVKAQ